MRRNALAVQPASGSRKKITAVFGGGWLNSDAGVLLLAGADRRHGSVDALASPIPDYRSPAHTVHEASDSLNAHFSRRRRFGSAAPPGRSCEFW
jgi:hypothetical protein